MTQVLPIDNASGYPDISFTTFLSQREFRIRFLWNDTDGFWYMDILDAEGEPVTLGTRVVLDWDLIRTITRSNRPPGSIFAISVEGQGPPKLFDLGTRVQLVYSP